MNKNQKLKQSVDVNVHQLVIISSFSVICAYIYGIAARIYKIAVYQYISFEILYMDCSSFQDTENHSQVKIIDSAVRLFVSPTLQSRTFRRRPSWRIAFCCLSDTKVPEAVFSLLIAPGVTNYINTVARTRYSKAAFMLSPTLRSRTLHSVCCHPHLRVRGCIHVVAHARSYDTLYTLSCLPNSQTLCSLSRTHEGVGCCFLVVTHAEE
jgi:hypothetical protein